MRPAAPPEGQSRQALEKQITQIVRLKYLLFLPKGYHAKRDRQWPLILFLHGAGERGDDLEKVKRHGIPKVVGQRDDFPFVVVSPQCPAGEWWQAGPLEVLLDEAQASLRIDPDRVYLTGLSMGGFGAWELAVKCPDRFAAVAPVCGGGNPYRLSGIAHVPVWAFHGAKDPLVPLIRSEEMVEALRKCGGDARLTVYPDTGHDSWTETYDNPELYEWFLRHPRRAAK